MKKYNVKLLMHSYTLTLLLRFAVVYVLVWILRIVFYLYNLNIVKIEDCQHELPLLIRGAFIFDASNLALTFSLFFLVALLPFKFIYSRVHQRILFIIFLVGVVGLVVVNLMDTVYFHYVNKRITMEEFFYFDNNNTSLIIGKGLVENWYLLLLAIVLLLFATKWYKSIKLHQPTRSGIQFYVVGVVRLLLFVAIAIIAIRGGVTKAIRPITLSNASQFAESPAKTFLVLNNPFCILKSIDNSNVEHISYYNNPQEVYQYFSPLHAGSDSLQMKNDNVIIFIIESYSYEHSRLLNPNLYPNPEDDFTPFLDSLMQEGYIFDNCYSNGLRSIDALPSVIASIPSFKTSFTLTTQAIAPMNGLGTLLGNEGWDSWFFNGSEERSLGFVAFAKSAGYRKHRTKENYEAARGTNDFDGYWGIWDDKFLDYMADELDNAKPPFLATAFTITNHHPFMLPETAKEKLPKGKTIAHRSVAYTDYAIRKFFDKAKVKPWYKNTIFVFVADHVGPEKYARQTKVPPGNSHILYTIFTPNGRLKGKSKKATQQIDIMPTVLGMLNYNKPYFAFGNDFFNEQTGNFAINYFGEKYRWITDSATYEFNNDTTGNILVDKKIKAFIQSYYRQMEKRDFTINSVTEKE